MSHLTTLNSFCGTSNKENQHLRSKDHHDAFIKIITIQTRQELTSNSISIL